MGHKDFEIEAAPKIDMLTRNGDRPFWSVMIPTYRPNERFLREALESILAQDPGADLMQIEVIDDHSPDIDVSEMVYRIAGKRVAYGRTPRNLGLAGCWNMCVAQSKGQWIHLLHQDDFVCDGFYSDLASLIGRHANVGAAFCRNAIADLDGHWLSISPLEQSQPGVLTNWVRLIATWQRVQCAAIVVRHDSYKALGGFRGDLPYTLDWEMWARLAKHSSIAYSPRILAVYRMHNKSETTRLKSINRVQDIKRGYQTLSAGLEPSTRSYTEQKFREAFAEAVKIEVRALIASGHTKELRQLVIRHWFYFPFLHKIAFTYKFFKSFFSSSLKY